MKHLTLVAYLYNKPEALSDYIRKCNGLINNFGLADYYEPLALNQIHATIIGLEMVFADGTMYNRNYFEKHNLRKSIDLMGMQEVFESNFPMSIIFGGFYPEYTPFLSVGKSPYERSFTADIKSQKVVMMGWPHVANNFNVKTILNLRNRIEEHCYIAHKYKEDNDLYMVLGTLNSNSIDSKEVNELNYSVRQYMAQNPLDLSLTIDDIYLVRYSDIHFPEETTEIYPLMQFIHRFPDFLYALP
jgi:hypothetical protein